MDAVDHWSHFGLESLRCCHVGGNHEVLDHTVGIKPLADGDFSDSALLVQLNPAFGKFQFERVTVRTGLGKQFPACPQVLQMLLSPAFVDAGLGLFIGDDFVDADEGAGEAPFGHLALSVDLQVTGHGGAVLARAQ